MLNSVLKLFAVLLSLLLLFLYPLLESYQRQDDMAMMTAYRTAQIFVDTIKDKGVITPKMYTDFTSELSLTGYEFDISLAHYAKKYDPEYDDPTDQSTFQDRILLRYELTSHDDIVEAMFPSESYPQEDRRRQYRMSIGDYIQMKVTPSQQTRSSMLAQWLSFGDQRSFWSMPFGGMIRNEAA